MIDGVAAYGFVLVIVVTVRFGLGAVATVRSGVRLFVRSIGFDVGAFGWAQRSWIFFGDLGLFDAFVGNFDFVDDANFLRFRRRPSSSLSSSSSSSSKRGAASSGVG